MFQTIYVGKLSGIAIYIHWSFWLIAIYFFLSNISLGVGHAIASVGFLFAVFFCVFLHEMGHALSAKWFDVKTLDITLLPFGGLARLERMPRTPLAEMVIALAGPAVNVVIALSLLIGISIRATFELYSNRGISELGPLEQLLFANVVLAVFNLIPAFPMDGGRVLRAFLAFFLPYLHATVIAARIGQVLAVVMIIAGLIYQLPLALVGVFVLISSTTEMFRERLRAVASQAQQWSGSNSAGSFSFTFGDGFSPASQSRDVHEIIDAEDVRRIE